MPTPIATKRDTDAIFVEASSANTHSTSADTKADSILSAIGDIQNNSGFSTAIPTYLIPVAGSQAFLTKVNLYNAVPIPIDPDLSEINIRIYDSGGSLFTARLYQDLALTIPLANPTDVANFPPASGWRTLIRESVGKYLMYFKVNSTDVETELFAEFGWTIAAVLNGSTRSAQILSNDTTQLTAIYNNTVTLVADTTIIKADTTTLKGNATTIIADTTTLKGDTATIIGDTTTIKADTTIIKGDTTTLKADTTIIKAQGATIILDSTNILADTLVLKNDTNTIKGDTSTIISMMTADINFIEKTIDLNNPAGIYDLLTCGVNGVQIESFIFRCPNSAAGGLLTGIEIYTNTSTPHVFMTTTEGLVSNLTAQAEFSDSIPRLMLIGEKVRLRIYGGATGIPYVCRYITKYRPIAPGGALS